MESIAFFIGLILGAGLVIAYKCAAKIRERQIWARHYRQGFWYGFKHWLKYDTVLKPFLTEWEIKKNG